MKPCPLCQTPNAVESKFCKHCGIPLSDEPNQPTIRLESLGTIARELLGKILPRRQMSIDQLFGNKERILVGRDRDNDVPLPHPSISRQHAILTKTANGLLLDDRGSVNGVYVNGKRLTQPIVLKDGDKVGIGPFLFSLSAGNIVAVDSSQSLRLEARDLWKSVPLADGGERHLLANVSLVIEPGEFVSLLGPSGAGKSTLMDCLNGRRRASQGHVLANGEDFYRHFASFRQSIGYVPQRDIIHTQLTVERALYYTAKLRLPSDSRREELDGRIEEVLNQMELQPHRHTLVGELSGGQIKRVSLGAELIARPCLLYIDEATSGLDAGTEARMMRLFRRLSDEGKSVVCITHNIDNVDSCHLIAILVRGRLAYFGPPAEAPDYFRTKRISEVYDRLAERPAEEWEGAFRDSRYFQQYIAQRIEQPEETLVHRPGGQLGVASVVGDREDFTEITLPPPPPPSPEDSTQITGTAPPAPMTEVTEIIAEPRSASRSLASLGPEFGMTSGEMKAIRAVPNPPRAPFFHQFRTLTRRYLELLWSDKRSLVLLLMQAPIVAAFVLLGFVDKPYDRKIAWPRPLMNYERAMLNVVVERMPEDWNERDTLKEMLASGVAFMPDRVMVDPRFNYMLLFMLTIVVMWFGCNNAAKEIVKEEAIYSRERAINLSLFPYLASKFWVQSCLTIIQAALLLGCVVGVLELLHIWLGHAVPYPGYHIPYVQMLGVFALLGMTGVALGLVLSASVSSTDRANTLLPYVLIPQIILGGGLILIQGEPLRTIAVLLSPVYWAFRAVKAGETELPVPLAELHDDVLWLPCAALILETVVLLIIAAVCLRRKDLGVR